MPIEHEPSSLSALEQSQQNRLSIIEQRRVTLAKIQGIEAESQVRASLPEGRVSWEQDLEIADARLLTRRAGRIANRLGFSITTMEQRAVEIVNTITTIRRQQQEEVLIPQAEEYLEKIHLKTEQLAKMHQAFGRGDLSSKTYRQREREFRSLTGEPGRNPDLKRGLELLKARQEQERQRQEQTAKVQQPPAQPETTPLPAEQPIPTRGTIEFTPAGREGGQRKVTTHEIQAGDQIIIKKLGQIEVEALRILASAYLDHSVTEAEFRRQLTGGDKLGRNTINNIISRLRKKLQPDWMIVQTVEKARQLKGEKGAWSLVRTAEQQPKPHQLTLYRDNPRLIRIGASIIKLAKMERRVLQLLLGNPGQQMTVKMITEGIYGLEPHVETNMRRYLNQLEQKFKEAGKQEALTTGREDRQKWGKIQGVEIVWEDSATGERKPRTIPNLTPSRRDTVLSFINNPDVTRETIINTLGPSEKTGKLLP